MNVGPEVSIDEYEEAQISVPHALSTSLTEEAHRTLRVFLRNFGDLDSYRQAENYTTVLAESLVGWLLVEKHVTLTTVATDEEREATREEFAPIFDMLRARKAAASDDAAPAEDVSEDLPRGSYL